MALTPATNRQVPDHSIMDYYEKQNYLGNQFIYTSSVTPGVTTELPILLLQNPTVVGSGFPSGYKALFVNTRKVSSTTASATAILRYYLSPTFSVAGATQTPLNLRPASPNTSQAVLSTLPTVSANGKLVFFLSSSSFVSDSDGKFVIVDPGQTLLVTAQSSSGSGTLLSSLGWFEQ